MMRHIEDDSMDFLPSPEGYSPPSQSHHNKGGKKPVNSAVEQRKQRNRQAQAAFRERRIEYIKELEATVAGHKTDLHRAQEAHSKATDECLMLRYKNSLLERILLEKGIDVQAELCEKTAASDLDPLPGWSRRRNECMKTSTLNSLSDQRRKLSKVPTARSENSPPSLANSPQSSTTEGNLTSNTPITPSPPSASEFKSVSPTQDLQISDVAVPGTPQPPTGASQPPQTVSEGAQQAAASILTRIQSSKKGSMRDTAAYYLSSFLEHIENLEKQSESSAANGEIEPQPLAEKNNGHLGKYSRHCYCQMEPKKNQSKDPGFSFENVEDFSMTQILSPYDQMSFPDPFGLEASMQFPAQFQF